MRLMIISRSFPPRNSPRALQIGKVAQAIADRGVEVLVLAGYDSSHSVKPSTSKHGRVVYIPYRRPNRGKVSKALWEQLNSINVLNRWITQAVSAARNVIEDFKPDCILTSSMPFQSHLVGLAVKRFSGLPWIASFSDPWPSSYAPYPYYRRGFPIVSAFERHLFKRVALKSDAIHMPSWHGIHWVEKASGITIRQKALAIPHIGTSPPPRNDQSNYAGWLAHIGHLSRERVSDSLLTAIQEVHRRMPDRFKGLLCVGNVCPEFLELIRQKRMEHTVTLIGHVSAEEASQIAGSSAALLVIEADMPESPFLPSKFADYALTGKPILAITPGISAIREYLQSCTGAWAASHDAQAIAEALIQMFPVESGSAPPNDFESEALAHKFLSSTVGNLYRAALEALLQNGASL